MAKDGYQHIDRKKELFSDFLCDLNPHPEMKDIVRYVDENAVKRSIKNLILTNRYERLFQPDIGSDIRKILFEPMVSATAQVLKGYIRDTINAYEPRCKLLEVEVIPNEQRQMYRVIIIFAILNKTEPVQLDISLYRVR